MDMKERPIIMRAESVRAILDGRKTQTRRVLKPQPPKWIDSYSKSLSPVHWIPSGVFIKDKMGILSGRPVEMRANGDSVKCPYGKVGDRLWVRETFGIVPLTAYGATTDHRQNPDARHECAIYYAGFDRCWSTRKRPAIHMPRWASRILLEITDIRVERLQDISEEDAIAEGFSYASPENPGNGGCFDWYRDLWDAINGKNHPWSSNPWVWAIEFQRVEP